MKTRGHDPRCLDVAVAAAEGAQLAGSWPLASLDRLTDGSAQPGDVVWHARLEQRRRPGFDPQARLHLDVRASVARECQRCLQPVNLTLEVDRDFVFEVDEEAAGALDADSDDDVLVLSRRFDLRTLVEDELMLALPLVPRHEHCPVPLHTNGEPAAESTSQHPFAALAGLKRAPSR